MPRKAEKAKKSKTKNVALPDQRISKIFSEVSKRVSPTKEEAKKEKAFAEKLRSALSKELKSEAKVHFVGSTARDTGIRGDKDIDIFLAFNREKKRDYFENFPGCEKTFQDELGNALCRASLFAGDSRRV